jgi:L-ribulose-5-phosphate 4-epimerase
MPLTEALRRKLTNGGRVLAHQGQGDFVAGHISVRHPDEPGLFLMKPAGIGLEEMSPSSILTVDLEGRKVDGTMARHNEVFIHSELFRARADIQAVVHTHAPHAVAFSSLGRDLAPISNDAGFFHNRLPVYSETTDLIVSPERGKSVAKHFGQNQAVLLRNHGIVTAGRSIEEAVWVAVRLERACQCQLLAEAAGGPRCFVDEADVERKNKRGTRPDNYNNVFAYLVRCWCREHGAPGDPCCAEAYEIDTSGYEKQE